MSERKTVTSTDSVHTGDERRKALRLRPDVDRADVDLLVRRHGRDRRAHRGAAPRRRARRVRALRQPDRARRRAAPRRARGHGGRRSLLERHGCDVDEHPGPDEGGRARRALPGLLPDDARVRDRRARTVRGRSHAAARGGRRGPAGRLAPRDAPRAQRIADQPVPVVRRPRARGGRVQVAQDGQVDDRRDVRDAGQLPAGGLRDRSGGPQRDEVPRGSQRRARRRRVRAERPGLDHPRSAGRARRRCAIRTRRSS